MLFNITLLYTCNNRIRLLMQDQGLVFVWENMYDLCVIFKEYIINL